ncbi:nuclear transcription factor Y subunit B-4-like [Lycium barbarum]|uniref:nuclear transcription factor Y subunit B-4-like n=1 Tax=Lycium barbarum TaxID=112863 RepID=UPI00293EF2CF|nr:nuclear transcription factor Y subunit B-4-like [Lycium barbarum]
MVDNINIGSKYDRESSNYNSISEDGVIKEQERLLPIANVGRIMKQILPPNAKISKEAKETMQECVSEFISFVTGEASDKCHNEKRKTLNGDDICWALGSLGFDDYVEPLKRYLHKHRELEGERINQNKGVGLGNNIEDQRERVELTQRGSTISPSTMPFKIAITDHKGENNFVPTMP